MNSFKLKILGYLLGLGLIVGSILGAVLYFQFPEYYPNWFVEILVFFLLIESIILSYVESVSHQKESPRKLLNAYLISKIMKIFGGGIFVLIYYASVKEGFTNFVLVFVAFYLIFMAIETVLFSKIERQIKQKVEK